MLAFSQTSAGVWRRPPLNKLCRCSLTPKAATLEVEGGSLRSPALPARIPSCARSSGGWSWQPSHHVPHLEGAQGAPHPCSWIPLKWGGWIVMGRRLPAVSDPHVPTGAQGPRDWEPPIPCPGLGRAGVHSRVAPLPGWLCDPGGAQPIASMRADSCLLPLAEPSRALVPGVPGWAPGWGPLGHGATDLLISLLSPSTGLFPRRRQRKMTMTSTAAWRSWLSESRGKAGREGGPRRGAAGPAVLPRPPHTPGHEVTPTLEWGVCFCQIPNGWALFHVTPPCAFWKAPSMSGGGTGVVVFFRRVRHGLEEQGRPSCRRGTEAQERNGLPGT